MTMTGKQNGEFEFANIRPSGHNEEYFMGESGLRTYWTQARCQGGAYGAYFKLKAYAKNAYFFPKIHG